MFRGSEGHSERDPFGSQPDQIRSGWVPSGAMPFLRCNGFSEPKQKLFSTLQAYKSLLGYTKCSEAHRTILRVIHLAAILIRSSPDGCQAERCRFEVVMDVGFSKP